MSEAEPPQNPVNEIASLKAELAAARKELQSFSYSISHDLRAPLRAIDGFSRILQEDYNQVLDAEGQKYLGFVITNALHLSRLIEDLLVYYRLGQHHVQKTKVDMTGLFRSISTELRVAEKDRAVDVQIGEVPPAEADPVMLRQLIVQLLGNALKFSRGRNDAKVEVGSKPDGKTTVYFVRDNGVGFDMQYSSKLFTVFQKLHTNEEFEGSGIGLAISQRIVSRHGGKIWLESKPEEGTAAYFTLGPG